MSKIYIQTLEIGGIYSAIRAMRNPKDSWDRSDSTVVDGVYKLGEADLTLAISLIRAGKEHRKFLRQIHVWADYAMPRYFWQEADTYHFGTKNSTSTMHTLYKEPFKIDDFYMGKNPSASLETTMWQVIDELNTMRDKYLETKDYYWVIQMKRLLPESFIQLRTWDNSYEEIFNIYNQRKNHRLTEEWVDTYCRWVESLPYFKEFFLTEIKP